MQPQIQLFTLGSSKRTRLSNIKRAKRFIQLPIYMLSSEDVNIPSSRVQIKIYFKIGNTKL